MSSFAWNGLRLTLSLEDWLWATGTILSAWTEHWNCLGIYISMRVTFTLGVWKPLPQREQPPSCRPKLSWRIRQQLELHLKLHAAWLLSHLSCFHHSLTDFPWNEQSRNEMLAYKSSSRSSLWGTCTRQICLPHTTTLYMIEILYFTWKGMKSGPHLTQ